MAEETKPDDNAEITKEFVGELRRKMEGYRLKASETQTALEAERTAHAETKTKLEGETAARVTAEAAAITAKQGADARVLETELKAHAKDAGLIDADVLKLIDTSKLKVNDAGVIEGLAEVVEKFKTDKPHFFKPADSTTTTSTTTSTQAKPSEKTPGPKHASEMGGPGSPEYEAAKKELIRPKLVVG